MNKNILLCGVGGQGTVLASKLIAAAAMKKGLPVMSAETIGMAQKGGSVVSYIKYGDDIFCPIFGEGQADLIIAFEIAEAVRMLPYLKENGTLISNTCPIIPVSATLSPDGYRLEDITNCLKENVQNLFLIDAMKVCEKLGSPKLVNTVLLGEAIKSGALGLSSDDIKDAIKEKVKPQFFEINCRAIDYANRKDCK